MIRDVIRGVPSATLAPGPDRRRNGGTARVVVRWVAVVAIAGLLPAAPALSADTEDGGWELSLRPHVWLPSLDADAGTGDISTDIDVSSSDVVAELEGALMLNLEARKDRWGLLVHGMYSKVSADGSSPGPFFNLIDTTTQMGMLDVALFARVLEGERGWIDILVGGRYMYLGVDFDMQPDYEAADDISASLVDQTVDAVGAQVQRAADGIAADVAALPDGEGAAAGDQVRVSGSKQTTVGTDQVVDLIDRQIPNEKGTAVSWGSGRGTTADALRAEFEGRIEQSARKLSDAIQAAIAEGTQAGIDRALAALGPEAPLEAKTEAIRREIKNAAGGTIDDIKRSASAQTRNAIDQAERELTGVIEGAMDATANADISETHEWLDPYVGLRGRWDLSQQFFVGARADVGGFGVGSDLMWQVFGGVGYQWTNHLDLELGWRHLAIDFEEDGFSFDGSLSGAVLGMGYRF